MEDETEGQQRRIKDVNINLLLYFIAIFSVYFYNSLGNKENINGNALSRALNINKVNKGLLKISKIMDETNKKLENANKLLILKEKQLKLK